MMQELILQLETQVSFLAAEEVETFPMVLLQELVATAVVLMVMLAQVHQAAQVMLILAAEEAALAAEEARITKETAVPVVLEL